MDAKVSSTAIIVGLSLVGISVFETIIRSKMTKLICMSLVFRHFVILTICIAFQPYFPQLATLLIITSQKSFATSFLATISPIF